MSNWIDSVCVVYVYIAAMCLKLYVYAQSMWARLHQHFWREVRRRAGEMLLLAACFAGCVLGAFRGRRGRGGAERRQISGLSSHSGGAGGGLF